LLGLAFLVWQVLQMTLLILSVRLSSGAEVQIAQASVTTGAIAGLRDTGVDARWAGERSGQRVVQRSMTLQQGVDRTLTSTPPPLSPLQAP
jgi:hypothetical protein